MAEKDDHSFRRHSTRKTRAQTTSALSQPRKSFSSPNSPLNTTHSTTNPSRSRQLWNIAVESVLDHENTGPISTSTTSSAVGNEPVGWYNLTKR